MKKSKGPCWTGYTMVGMKSKGGRKVPNCVPVKKANKGLLAEPRKEKPSSPNSEMLPPSSKPFQDTIDKAKKFKNKKHIPGDPDKKRKYLIDIQNPISEYDKKGKLKYTVAKHGASIDAGGMSALGRIEKAGMVRGTGAAIKGLNFKGVF